MIDSNQDSTSNNYIAVDLGKKTTNWQDEYQKLLITSDEYLTRAIAAEGRLAAAKEVISTQEIDIKLWEQRHANNVRAIKEAANHMLEARRHLDSFAGHF
jgi:hypothetical protein